MEFYLELAKMVDLKELYELCNDEEVRKNSFNSEKISFADHESWFKKIINSKNSYLYVAKSKDNQLIGSLRFDRQNKSYFVISIQISKVFRGKGFAKKIILSGLDNMISKNQNLKIIAFIKKDNLKSIKTFKSVGFNIICEKLVKNSQSYILRYE